MVYRRDDFTTIELFDGYRHLVNALMRFKKRD